VTILNKNLKLSMDVSLTNRKLDNGLTYYIYENRSPTEKAIFSLIVKIGCVVEEINQRGIAHFIEHMCLADKLRFSSQDGNYLHNIEASGYTNFDETVFTLECLPLYKNIARSITALKKMADGSTIQVKQTEMVRHGIINEYNQISKKPKFKIREKVLFQLLNDSPYANMMPIGKLEHIRKVDYGHLTAFHSEWYCPELMAVIAVGNFETDMVEELIINNLSPLKNNKNSKKRIYQTIPSYEKRKLSINYFEDLPSSELHLYSLYPRPDICTIYDMKIRLTEYMSYYMMVNFLKNVFERESIPIQDLICTKDGFLNRYEFAVIAIKTTGEIAQVLSILIQQLMVIAGQGFSPDELHTCKKVFRQSLETSLNNSPTCRSRVLFNECLQHFLFNEPVLSLEKEYELNLNLIDEITMSDIIACQRLWCDNRNTAIAVNLPHNRKNTVEFAAINNCLNNLGCTAN